MTTDPNEPTGQPAAAHEIIEILGEIDPALVTAILDTGATVADVQMAAMAAAGQTEVTRQAGRPLAGAAAAVFDLLTADRPREEER